MTQPATPPTTTPNAAPKGAPAPAQAATPAAAPVGPPPAPAPPAGGAASAEAGKGASAPESPAAPAVAPANGKLEKARKALAKEQEKNAAVRAAQARATKLEADLAARTREAEELRRKSAELDAIARDPLAYLKSKGMPADQLARKAIEDGSVEGKLAAALARLDALEGGLTQREKHQREQQDRIAQAQAREAREHSFLQVLSDDSAYPEVAKRIGESRRTVLATAYAIGEDYREATARKYGGQGFYPDDRDLAQAVESWYKTRQGQKPQETAANGKSPQETRDGTETAPQPASPTLTSEATASRASLPETLAKMPRKQAIGVMADQLRERSTRRG